MARSSTKAAKQKRLVVIDGNALLHRAWHALPPLTTKKGVMVNAVYGFLLVFFKIWKDLKPTHGVVSFDLKGPTFRHEQYDGYKATRVKQPDELYDQIPILKKVLAALNVPVVEAQGYEADDVIGTIARQASKEDVKTMIVTGDLDTLQLVGERTSVVTLRKGLSDITEYTPATVLERYGLEPTSLVEYRGLKGDPSDNIPGVKGIGEKTAATLIQTFGTLEKLYAALEKKTVSAPLTPRLRELLLEHKDNAFLSRKLSEIHCDVPIKKEIVDFAVQPANTEEVISLFQELEFKSLLTKLPEISISTAATQTEQPIGRTSSYHFVQTDAAFKTFLTALKKQKTFVLDTETTGLNPFEAELLGMSFSWKEGEAYYVLLDGKSAWLEAFRPILENSKVGKWGHNIKYDQEVLATAGVSLQGIVGDTMIAAYLLNPGSRVYGLDALAFTEFGHRMIPITKLIGEKKPQKEMREVPVDDLAEYAAEDADYTKRLVDRYLPELKKNNLLKLFETIEVPLIPVLSVMEAEGVKVDTEALTRSSKETAAKIKKLEKKIHDLAGGEFNIASPAQLKVVLFEKLKISTQGIHKTKTGLSTAASELEKMKGDHPIIDLILEYRELTKLKSTYLDSLPELVDKNGRIHTNYNQTIAATGRLSSIDPNLQNIPNRTELGNEVRKAFVADKGNVLLSADYSQFELRIVAHLANDKAMIDIFRKGLDIHTATAAKIHGISESEVTKAIRFTAKEINFGIMYGMGSWGLAARTGLTQEEARDFIDKYFKTFSGVKDYIEETKAVAKKLGYVETIFGRRRYLPDIRSGMAQVRQAAERMAINMPVQGSQADFIKLAMVNVQAGLFEIEPKAKMLLQVHDELVFEVPEKSAEKVGAWVKDQMENVTKLRVPIEVNVQAGKNWGEMKPL